MDSSLPPTPRSASGLAPSTAPSPSTDVSLLISTAADPTRDEPDPTIVEALNGSKDRLFVLKLGDDFDDLLNERGNTPGKRCTYAPPSSYQRMLVYRCAQYYKLAIEGDGKTISVMLGPESRTPKCRISEIVRMEQPPAPAFKIMRRTADERARAKQPGRTDSTGDDQPDGTALTEEPKRRAQMTIEERTAAYEQARSRIFEGFQEKDDQPSPPPTRRDSGNSEPRWVDKQRRSDFSSSSRGSPIPQDMTTIPASYYPPMLFNPNAPSAPSHPPPQPYDPNVSPPVPYMYGPQHYPMYAYYPQPQYDPRQGPVPGMQMGYGPPQGVAYPFPPQHAATWPPPIQPQPQPQHQPQHSPETQRHAFPQMAHPPQPNRHMHMSPQNDPFPPHQYMQPYQYAGFMHQPVLVPTPPDAPGSGHSSRSGSRNGHGSGHGSNGSNGGAKGPRSSVGPWSASTVATPMRSVTGVNRRLSTSSSSTSAYSSSGGGPGSGSRTPADETASIASSASSSSSRRTYTSTSTTSKHPLPPRPDWAVGLMAEPSLSRTTSTSSSDSRLRMTSRSSSGNQIPRAGTGPVKLGTATNATDFPPLNGNGNGAVQNGARTGAWGREGSPATLFGNNMPSGNNMPPPAAGGRRFEETDSIPRPAPKSFGLYNPSTGAGPATLPTQAGTSPDALAEQVSKLSVDDGSK